MTIWHMGIAYLLGKTTDTHSEYVMRVAFPLLQWLHECANSKYFEVSPEKSRILSCDNAVTNERYVVFGH